jgi:hypothetical protein
MSRSHDPRRTLARLGASAPRGLGVARRGSALGAGREQTLPLANLALSLVLDAQVRIGRENSVLEECDDFGATVLKVAELFALGDVLSDLDIQHDRRNIVPEHGVRACGGAVCVGGGGGVCRAVQ